ncbi:MAG TPA: metallophosphoesterase [Casimicrobiaceae bacterium]|nr:metallophosphoesterase [Casimicrobiaceae bacterium]
MLRLYLLSALLHGYIGIRVLPDLAGGWPTAATAAVLIASALLVPLGFSRSRRTASSEWIIGAGLVAVGLLSSLLMATLTRDVALLVAFLLSPWIEASSRAAFTTVTALAVPIVATIVTGIGFINARRRARVRDVDVPIANLPPALQGFRIAQISDVHVGPTIKRRYVDAIVDAVNALEVDMVAVTGDLVDGSVRELRSHTEPLGRLASRHGTFFVTGNHEYYSGAAAWVCELTRLGLNVLQNQHVVIDHDGGKLVVAGVNDLSAHHFDPSQRSDPARSIATAPRDAAVKVLLAHQPRSAYAAEKAGFDLQLSGHTHGGQFVPWNYLVRFWQPFTAGLHRLGALWVYISRGTGYWGPPKRFGAPSEITRLRLVMGSV